MATYHQAILQGFANDLYEQAKSAVRVYTSLAALVGCLLGAYVGPVILHTLEMLIGAIIVGICCGAYVGYALGQRKAFRLKLQAQMVLCQMAVEQNTADLLKSWTGSR